MNPTSPLTFAAALALVAASPAPAQSIGSMEVICRDGKPVAIQIITSGPGVGTVAWPEQPCARKPAPPRPAASAPAAST